MLFNRFEKIFRFDFSVPQSAAQRITIDFVVEGNHYHAAIRVLHLHMAAATMHFGEAQAGKCGDDLLS